MRAVSAIRDFLPLALLALCIHAGPVAALTPEQATQVGGDLTVIGAKLTALKKAAATVVEAAPTTRAEVSAAFGRVAGAPAARDFATTCWLGLAAVAVLLALVYAFRFATARLRRRCIGDALHARGAANLLGLETADWALLAGGAYLLIEFQFNTGDLHDLLVVAVLWALVRWRLYLLLLETLLRPGIAAFRLVAMDDRTARQVKLIAALPVLVGLAGISVMPVLLRAGLPVPAGQVVVLLQGLLLAAGCLAALWRYRAARSAPAHSVRLWTAFGVAGLLVLWPAWTVGTLLLEFSTYHSLVWSVRIAMLAYVVHALLGLSSNAGWVLLVQRSITAAALLAIAILLAQVWLVDELALIAQATWLSVRRSLVTAAATLFVGYVGWRYLHHWTEERLRAAAPGLNPASEDEGAHPASRLTTILPMLRILAGIAILVVVALLALSQLGVEITPLLAGAGVFGLAISFGSQALVRDVVSGIFFMADDAFRVGEYIDTGRLKGTVERISLRSVRLRHHNGQVHTIPFGQLTSITNFSRDWQTVKFNLRLARDTDIEKVRKTVKQLGQEMLKDPELGKELLQPLKLQGVAEIADSALVVRLKFTVRPLKPSWVQREALKRLHRVFNEKGIKFASGAITVETTGSAPPDLAAAGGAAIQGRK